MHDTFLDETLDAIATERSVGFHQSFKLAKRLVEQWGEAELADRLYAAIPSECSWKVIANLFDILAWTCIEDGINDNGAAMTRTIERWLRENDDMRKIHIALNLEVYPFINRVEMENVLEEVARIHSEVADRCRDVIHSRRQHQE